MSHDLRPAGRPPALRPRISRSGTAPDPGAPGCRRPALGCPPHQRQPRPLRILLNARQEITAVNTAQTNRLRALLAGDDTDRQTARSALTATTLAYLARRELPAATKPCVTRKSSGSRRRCSRPGAAPSTRSR
jgi:hypothetical protein